MTYIQHSETDVLEMLAELGLSSVSDLFSHIDDSLKFRGELGIPDKLIESKLIEELSRIADENRTFGGRNFRGAGIYQHFIPRVIDHLVLRGEFLTAYTPYQPEFSQGILQAFFEYQSMICEITGCDLANASVYDGSTALTEGVFVATSVNAKRSRVLVSESVHPQYRQVLRTNTQHLDHLCVETVAMNGGVTDLAQLEKELAKQDVSVVAIQSPNALGVIEDGRAICELAHKYGALTVFCVNPISLGVLEAPANFGADVVVGDGSPLGSPMALGGPHFGFVAARKDYVRKMPGRIVGETADTDGKRGYVLVFQTREQHIRREKATSNICTNQGLFALRCAIHLAMVGKSGFARASEICARRAHFLADELVKTGNFELVFPLSPREREGVMESAPFFNEFALRSKKPLAEVVRKLRAKDIDPGFELGSWYPELSDALLIAVTEVNTRADLDAYVTAAKEL
ncbi:MAG: aminomethyl-transferring glycine dehydrogenase subunit GcvPA [Planctomycetes bacterium]|nr:aminomethyl-transferring glycine dehydrogenase subunit GcvPA [Planctomycetota bacterium]